MCNIRLYVPTYRYHFTGWPPVFVADVSKDLSSLLSLLTLTVWSLLLKKRTDTGLDSLIEQERNTWTNFA